MSAPQRSIIGSATADWRLRMGVSYATEAVVQSFLDDGSVHGFGGDNDRFRDVLAGLRVVVPVEQ